MGRVSYYIQGAVLLLLSLMLFSLPAPFLLKEGSASSLWVVVLFLILVGFVKLLIGFSRSLLDQRSLGELFPWLTLVFCSSTFCLSYFNLAVSYRWLVLMHCAIVFCLFVVSWCMETRYLRYSSLVCLLFTCCLIASTEQVLNAVPENRLIRSIRKMPVLAPPDRSFKFYESNKFRGKYPCVDCGNESIRIFTMGGSATYGTPMHSGEQTFAAYLERLLSERRLNEKYEVFNAGIPGHGITQIYNVIKEKIIHLKPDIIAINCWFNDSSSGMSWYGLPDKTDWEAYKQNYVLWKLQENPVFSFFYNTRLMGLFRHYLLGLKSFFVGAAAKEEKAKEKSKPFIRVPTDQYKEILEEIVQLGKKHNFVPVFMLEPVNRTGTKENALKHNRYYRVIEKVAEENKVPVVSALDQLHARNMGWLFYDFIHPNGDGHRIIAEELYDTLFSSESELLQQHLERRGVDRTLAKVESAFRFHYEPARVSEGLKLSLAAPFLGDMKRDLLVQVNRGKPVSLGPLSSQAKDYLVAAELLESNRPLGQLEFRAAVPAELPANAQVGKSQLFSPVQISMLSAGKDVGWGVRIAVAGTRVDLNYRSYNVAVLDSVTGDVKRVERFDTFGYEHEASKLITFLEDLRGVQYSGAAPLVLIAVKTDGSEHVDKARLGEILKKFGGTGVLPERFESFLFVGSPSMAQGEAIEQVGLKKLELEIGSEALSSSGLLHLAQVPETLKPIR
ncbi:MAG: hypothetical protein KDD62_03380 [Bdellovibrionales bacterium]|nr:hypothetical protein [Bdellovibrionales bacterium]